MEAVEKGVSLKRMGKWYLKNLLVAVACFAALALVGESLPKSWLMTTAESREMAAADKAADAFAADWLRVHCRVERVEPGLRCSLCQDDAFLATVSDQATRLGRDRLLARLGGDATAIMDRGVTYCEKQ